MAVSIGIDVGGTYTDIVVIADDGTVQAGKVLSTPADQGDGVEAALREHAGRPEDVGRVVHGTTIVTNLLLERRGARVVLCATAGATDLLELRRQERASLYDLSVHHPPAIVPVDRVVPVEERIAPEGVLLALTAESAESAALHVAELTPEIVAVSLLHSYADARHEQLLAKELRRQLPRVDVVCSSDVLPEIREYERTATTCAEAYARPRVAAYLEGLTGRLASLGFPAPGVVSSSGGMASGTEAAHAAASLALSGPAGGVAGAALVARLAGFERALSIDIGGTSADVGLILDGEPLVEAGGEVAGVPIALPRVLVETVSAGGGSLGWVDDGGALRVGPRSAGAVPGPVAFGRGGTEATVTDAHIALGNIVARQMSGAVRLDEHAAMRAVGEIAARLGVDTERAARAMIATADAAMARALRRVSVERGIDPRGCVLVAFGGGGPLHACGLATALGMTRILVPPHAGVLSALGLAVAPSRRSSMASVMRTTRELEAGALEELCARLEARARAIAAGRGSQAEDSGRAAWTARARYRGQGHELEIPLHPSEDAMSLERRFAERHGARYGFTLSTPVEVVSARVTITGASPPMTLHREGRSRWSEAEAFDDGGCFETTVIGRRVVALTDATLLVEEGWSARPLELGGWSVEKEDAIRTDERGTAR